MSDELKRLQEATHPYIGVSDFDGRQIPVIGIDDKRFDEILQLVYGKPLVINTDLNILQDGLGHVFVEVKLTFSHGGIKEKFLVDAKKNLKFFEALAETANLALTYAKDQFRDGKVFMVQLPKIEKAETALAIIQDGLSKGK